MFIPCIYSIFIIVSVCIERCSIIAIIKNQSFMIKVLAIMMTVSDEVIVMVTPLIRECRVKLLAGGRGGAP